jgi:hypothetical protein
MGADDELLEDDDSSSAAAESAAGRFLELRCILAVVRHGDRTPKQKMKMPVSQVGGRRGGGAEDEDASVTGGGDLLRRLCRHRGRTPVSRPAGWCGVGRLICLATAGFTRTPPPTTRAQPAMLELFQKYRDSKGKQAKLKSPAQLQVRPAPAAADAARPPRGACTLDVRCAVVLTSPEPFTPFAPPHPRRSCWT